MQQREPSADTAGAQKRSKARYVPSKDANRGWDVASRLVAGLLVWGLLGWYADTRFGTGPWLLVIGLLLGHAGGLLSVYTAARRDEERDAAVKRRSREQARGC